MSRPLLVRRALCAALLQLCAIAPARAGVANFENFTEGDFFFPSFTDPASGIFFVDSTGPDPGEWVIEFTGARPDLPTASPGNYLSSLGYVPGPSLLLPYEFGIRGILPTLADRVSMTLIYATDPGASIALEGFDPSGTRVAVTTLVPPSAVMTGFYARADRSGQRDPRCRRRRR